MTIDTMESLVACGCIDQKDLAYRFAQSYQWSRGYSPATAKLLKRIRRGQSWETVNRSVYPDGSFGNGGAMRSPAIGLFFATDNEDELVNAACSSADVTHPHQFAREGAVLIALTSALACKDIDSTEIIERLCQRIESPEFLGKLLTAKTWLQAGANATPRTVVAGLGNGFTAVESCVTAIYIALAFRNRSFNDLLAFAISLQGDVDTIAAMACAIWGTVNGSDAIPHLYLEQLEQYDRLKTVAQSLSEAVSKHQTTGNT